MSMPQAQFDALVKQLEAFAKKQPGRYKFQVRLLALLGYGYIIVTLGIIITLSILFLPKLFAQFEHVRSTRLMALMLLFGVGIPAVLIFCIVEALWFHIPPPNGLELKSRQVPRLFQLVRDLQRELKTPPVHYILLTDEFNAAMAQIPRFGFFGGYRNYLIVGLPLLQTLAPAQFRAVLAHELGHLSGRHGQFGHWIYRVRQSWYQLLASLENAVPQTSEGAIAIMLMLASMIGRGIFVFFFHWYTPFFAAYSFVLARADEYEADRYAAKLAGAKNLASALASVEIKGGYVLPTFWRNLGAKADVQLEPPNPYTELAIQMQQPLPSEDAKTWLKEVLERQTDTEDTHPCLKDRLNRMGCKPNQVLPLLKPTKTTAAEQFLGKALPQLLDHFNQVWQGAITHQWRERYQETQTLKQQLASLEESDSDMPLSLAERWQRANLTAELKGVEAALPDLQTILSDKPNHLGAHSLLGQLLLSKGDRKGIQHLEKVMMRDSSAYAKGVKLIAAFLHKHDGEAIANQYLTKARQQAEVVRQARFERSRVTHHHTFVLSELTPAVRQSVQVQLKAYADIKVAYLVQKVVKHLPDSPLYVLAIEPTDQALIVQKGRSPSDQLMDALVNELDLPDESILILLDKEQTALKVKLRKMEGAKLYSSL
ncbi:MAG: M48 family metalloprotease [Cyanobacteria bacterium P01_A01_bin.123]